MPSLFLLPVAPTKNEQPLPVLEEHEVIEREVDGKKVTDITVFMIEQDVNRLMVDLKRLQKEYKRVSG